MNVIAENAGAAERLLKLMANEVRLIILNEISIAPRSVGDLIEKSGLSQSALSQHLAKLRAAGVVRTERNGQEIYYRIESAEIEAVLQTLFLLFRRA